MHDDVLERLRSGRRESLDELTALLYDELREIAHRHRKMRHILTDRARARLTAKRGGAHDVVTLDDQTIASEEAPRPIRETIPSSMQRSGSARR